MRTWDGGWTVFHLPSTLGSPTAVRSRTYGPDFEGLHFDLVVLLPGLPRRHASRPWSEHGAAAATATALLDVAAPAVCLCRLLGSSGDRTILRREEVEQRVGLLVDRLPATRLQQHPSRGSLHGEVLTVIGAG